MSPNHPHNNVLQAPAEEPAAIASRYDFAIYQEFSFARREAQAEANVAYEDWRHDSCMDAYVVYRAAQDRADAAQDALAEWAVHVAA
jgi:hypothetical protein